MKNCMVDLETLGTVPGCSIIAIGAVLFDQNKPELGDNFYVTISRESCVRYGLVEDPKTIAWWADQSPQARALVDEVSIGGTPLPQALKMFDEWLAMTQYKEWLYADDMTSDRGTIMSRLSMWGNGADFDNAFLQVAYSKVGGTPSWKFCNNRCYRTLKALYPQHKLTRVGVHHNALDDAKTQAQHAVTLLRAAANQPPIPWWRQFWSGLKQEFKWLP